MVLPSKDNWRRNRTPSPFDFGGIFDEVFQNLENSLFGDSSLARLGNTDIYEKDGELNYELELPGLSKDQIKIQVKENQLIITGEVKQEEDEEGVSYISRGRRYGRFRRSLPLPEEVENPSNLKAKFENGILHIRAKLSKSIKEEETVEIEIE